MSEDDNQVNLMSLEDDVLEAVLQEVDAKALCQLKAVSMAWRARARSELCGRLTHREGKPTPTGFVDITDLDVECLQDAGRPWEVVVAGRQLPQLARLHGYGFVVDVQAVRQLGARLPPWTPWEEFKDDDDADDDTSVLPRPSQASLGGAALRSCIEGEGEPPHELLLAAVACAASRSVRGIPVQQLREDDAIGSLNLSNSGLGVISAGLLALMLPVTTSVRFLRCDRGTKLFSATSQPAFLAPHPIAPAFLSEPIDTPTLSLFPILPLARSLEYNSIGAEGASALAAILNETKITNLDLSSNKLGPQGGAALAEGLKGNSTLQSLDLSGSWLCGLDGSGNGTYTAEGITKLCEGLTGSAV